MVPHAQDAWWLRLLVRRYYSSIITVLCLTPNYYSALYVVQNTIMFCNLYGRITDNLQSVYSLFIFI